MFQEPFTPILQDKQMEELIFYQYLEYQKSHSTPFTQRLFNLPPIALLLFFGTLGSAAIGVWLLCISRQGWATLAAIIEFALCFGFELYIEHFQIIHSKTKTERRFVEWYQLRDWLTETPGSDATRIAEIKERLELRVKTEQATKKALWEHLEKWIQLLAFPLVLVIATKSINEQDSMAPSVAIAITILIVCGIIYFLIKLLVNTLDFPKTWRLKQMALFAEDLQGVLDLDRFGIEKIEPITDDTILH